MRLPDSYPLDTVNLAANMGHETAIAGVDGPEVNPWPKGSPEHQAWVESYCYAVVFGPMQHGDYAKIEGERVH